MKPMTVAWLGVAGISLFVLLGNLFAAYPDLKAGVIRVLVVMAVALLIAVALQFAAARHQDPSIGFDRKPLIGLGVLVLALMIVGGV